MKCPYCIGEINDAALVCTHCARDLYLFKPLLAQVSALESGLAAMKSRVELLEAQRQASAPLSPETDATPDRQGAPADSTGSRLIAVLGPWLAPLALLVAAHFLITIVYDANMVWLRLVSMAVPLPFGYYLMSSRFRSFPVSLTAAFLVACLAVVAMSGVVHLVDGTAVLPQNRRGWQEFIEYASSISFSFATGMVLGRRSWRKREAARVDSAFARALAGLAAGAGASTQKINAVTALITDLSKSVTAAGTAAAALYTGLRAFH